MKNLRKDAIFGLVLLAAWLVIKLLFRGDGIFLWLLGPAGVVFTIIGLLPDPIHSKVMALKDKLLGSKGK